MQRMQNAEVNTGIDNSVFQFRLAQASSKRRSAALFR